MHVEEWRRHSVQSPIELRHDESNEYDNFEPLEFYGHWDAEGKTTFTNNGYTGISYFCGLSGHFKINHQALILNSGELK